MSPECLGDSSSSSTRSSRQPSNHTTSSSAASAAALSISTSLQEKEKKFTNYLSPVPDSTSATPIVPCSNNNNSNNNNGRAIRGMDADCLIGEVASFDDNLLPSSLPVCSALTAIAPSSPSKGELVHSTALAAASHAPYPTAANDVWALGVILVNLLTSRNPWCEPSIADYMFADFVREARHHALIDFFKYQFGLASPIGRILEGCFELDPENRWNVSMLRMAVEEVLEEQMDILYYNHPGNKMESPVQSPAIVGSYSNPSSIVLPSSSSSAAARRRSSATDKMVEFDPIHEEQDENSNNCITSQQQNVPDDMSSHGHNGNQLNNSTGDYRFSHKTTAPINADTRSSKSRQSTDSSHSWASDGSSEMDFDSIPSFSDGVTYVRYASSAPSTSLFMNSKVAAAVAVGLVASSPTAVPVAKTSTSNSTAVTTAVNVTTTPTSSTPSFGTTRTSIVSANTVPASSSGSASLLLSSASALDAVVSSSAFPAVTKNPSSMVSELSAAVSKMNNNEAIVAAAAVGIAKKGYYEEDLFMDDEHQHPSNDSFGDTHDYNDEEEEDDDDEEEQEEGKDHVNLALSVKRRTSTSTSPAATTTTTTSKPIAIPVRKSVSEHHLNNAEMDGLSDRMMGKHRMTTCEKPIAYNGSTAVTISSAAAPCTPPKSDSINVNSNSAITHSESKKKKKKKPKKKKKASSMSAVGVSGSISDMSALTDLLGSPSKVQPVPAPSIQAQHNINKELQQQQPSSSNATISSSSINNSNPTITNNNTSNRKPSRNHPSRIVHRASPNVVATPSRAPPGEPQYSLPQADVVNALRGLMRGILNLHHHHQGFSAAAAMQPQVPPGGFGIHHHHHHQQQLTMQMTSNSTVAAAAGGGPSVAANALLGGIPVHLRSRSGIQVFSITFFHNQQQPPLPPPQSRS